MGAVDGIDEFAAKLAGILKEKNESYGDSLAKVPTMLSFIFPEIPVEKIALICAFSRALEKFGRMASNPTAFGEDPWTDVAGAFLVHANIDRLKREAKPLSGMAQREAIRKHAGSMPGLNIDSIYDEPDDGEAPAKAEPPFECVEARRGTITGWAVKREGVMLPWIFTERSAALFFIANYVTGDEAEALRATDGGRGWLTDYDAKETSEPAAPPPSEPNGRIKRDIWPFVVVHATKTGWYLKHTGWNGELFNAYAGGCWHLDERDATAFPSEEAAIAYLRRHAELNAVPPGGTVPPAEPKAARDETFEEAAAVLTPALRESFKALLVALRKASSCG